MIKEVIYKMLYALFPRRCELCGSIVALDICRCDNCLNLPQIKGDVCSSCGCAKSDCNCKKHKNEYKAIIAPYYYKDYAVCCVHRFKFNDYPELSVAMAKDIAHCVKERYNDIDFDCVTYVPLSKKRFKKRGYNQSQLLAESIGSEIGVEVKNLLYKVFDNKSQRTQSHRERKVNVYGAYDLIDNVDVADKTILLIDDVKTTGSTLNECAKMLKIYGAKSVYCATFAITMHNKK